MPHLRDADPQHPDHAEAAQWLDEYDPEIIDELPIKYGLDRNAARARLAKNKQPRSAD